MRITAQQVIRAQVSQMLQEEMPRITDLRAATTLALAFPLMPPEPRTALTLQELLEDMQMFGTGSMMLKRATEIEMVELKRLPMPGPPYPRGKPIP